MLAGVKLFEACPSSVGIANTPGDTFRYPRETSPIWSDKTCKIKKQLQEKQRTSCLAEGKGKALNPQLHCPRTCKRHCPSALPHTRDLHKAGKEAPCVATPTNPPNCIEVNCTRTYRLGYSRLLNAVEETRGRTGDS
eukprot:GHVT01053154.1.p1 GENE.GHVT01053154.1~~GHVT01053154.1.p1  ORF type:complete len:137 (+),score=2.20 GHVT01053154.1:212-622(+)